MNSKKKILMVDDHPLIIEGYKNVLNNSSSDIKYSIIDTANDLSLALSRIQNAISPYDLVCLDMNLPPAEEVELYSGEDLGTYLRKNYPDIKLIVLTMQDNNFRLYNILKNINPEGFLIKKDIRPINLIEAFNQVLEGKSYFSHTVTELLRKQFQTENLIDASDRQILYYISIGLKTKDLPKKIPLSLAAIEKRKRLIKEALGIVSSNDLILINRARELGFI